jgi:hypothetical protein
MLQLCEIVLRDCLELYEIIPSPDGINIKKLGQHGLIMTNSCNAGQKARRLLQLKIGGIIFKFERHHHLQNVWVKGMEMSVSSFLQVIIANSLEKILLELQVTCVYSPIARAWDKKDKANTLLRG